MTCVNVMSWNAALPSPPPLPEDIEPAFETPHEYDSTSISSLCLSSSDSPLISPSFAKMSAAISPLLSLNCYRGSESAYRCRTFHLHTRGNSWDQLALAE